MIRSSQPESCAADAVVVLLCCCCLLSTQNPSDYASVMLKLQTIINGPALTSKVSII